MHVFKSLSISLIFFIALSLAVQPCWAGTTEIVSVSSNGEQANAHISENSISADGRFVAFIYWANNLVPRARKHKVCKATLIQGRGLERKHAASVKL